MIKVQFMVPAFLYTVSIESTYKQQKGGILMSQEFRYVGGHIEVYSENGEFLFSADTMQEAWEELSA